MKFEHSKRNGLKWLREARTCRDPAYYRERAKAWRDKATTLPEDHLERAVCIELAEGYERLAALLEQRRWQPVP